MSFNIAICVIKYCEVISYCAFSILFKAALAHKLGIKVTQVTPARLTETPKRSLLSTKPSQLR